MVELNTDWMIDELEANVSMTHESEALIAQMSSDLAFADWFLEDESAVAQVQALLSKG
jgi:hypothetical protein